MWIIFAFVSAVFAGITSILAKCGIRKTDSTVATAIRTFIVLLMSFLMVLVVGSLNGISNISPKTWIFLILSGLSTGASWLCYYKALQLEDVNKVVPIDKSATILTIILAFIVFHETISFLKVICIVLITIGTYLMIEMKAQTTSTEKSKLWLIYALLSAVFASLTSILGKIGIDSIESNLGTMIRTSVVLVMAWLMVFITGKEKSIKKASPKELTFICLSGVATGASWLCYYKALKDGVASIVVPIDKLSIVITIAFSCIFLRKKLSKRSAVGLALIVTGTLAMLI